MADEQDKITKLRERARLADRATRDVVELGMVLEHLRHPLHSQSTNGAPKLRHRIEARYLKAVARLEDALEAEDELVALEGSSEAR